MAEFLARQSAKQVHAKQVHNDGCAKYRSLANKGHAMLTVISIWISPDRHVDRLGQFA
jgi:hypothetical protein